MVVRIFVVNSVSLSPSQKKRKEKKEKEMESSRLPNKQGTRRYPCRRVEVSSSGLIPGSHEREPALDVRSYSTFRRCSLQFKRGSTIIGGIPFDIKCLAFVTRSSPQLPATEEERIARSFSSFSLSSFLTLPFFPSFPSFLFTPLLFYFSSASYFFFFFSFFFYFFLVERRRAERKLEEVTPARVIGRRSFYANVFHYTPRVYTGQCNADNWIRVPARVRDNIRVNEERAMHRAPMYICTRASDDEAPSHTKGPGAVRRHAFLIT